jgi:hypothetical protein
VPNAGDRNGIVLREDRLPVQLAGIVFGCVLASLDDIIDGRRSNHDLGVRMIGSYSLVDEEVLTVQLQAVLMANSWDAPTPGLFRG